MYGHNSQAGYILNGDTYVNLDKGLINYFFEYEFYNSGFYDQRAGYKINKDEDLVLEYGNIITKETMIEVSATDDLIDETTIITPENINLERIRFQVDGNTSLHLFALDYNTLSLILNYMEEHRPAYLTSILMKNNKGKSPLDITIDNESPKNTELLLLKLARFKDESLSKLFYDRFDELLGMDISAFHEYLDSCFYQTIQMKTTKYLKLKSDKDPWLVTHSSCLIDEVFIDKYCDTSEKKALAAEKKRKEEEEKKKAEEDAKKAQEEEKRKAEREAKGLPPEEQAKDSIIDHEKDKSAVEEPKKKKTKEELEREKERKKQKRLDIRAIEFDWIFSKDEGVTFLENLATTDNIELFSLTLIRYIIRFLWTFYRKAIVLYLFIPFLIYFTLFILYATWIHDKAFDDGNEYSKNYGIANIIMIITILIFISYFFYFEIRQMMFHKLNYFISFWNLIDLISLILNGFIMIYDLSGGREQRLVTLQGIAVLFIWLKLFYFGRIFLSTAAMIRMIIEITVDMKYFLVVLLMAI